MKQFRVICTIATAVLFISCSKKIGVPSAPQSSAHRPIETSSRFIESGTGGTLSLSNGTGVVIPPNVLSRDATVSIEKCLKADAPPAGAWLDLSGYVYLFEAGQAAFNGNVTIEIRYRDEDVPAGYSAGDLKVFCHRDGAWSAVAAVNDPAQNKLTVGTDHFSPWGTGVAKGSPTPGVNQTITDTLTPFNVILTRTPTPTVTPSDTFSSVPAVIRTPTPGCGASTCTFTPAGTSTRTPTPTTTPTGAGVDGIPTATWTPTPGCGTLTCTSTPFDLLIANSPSAYTETPPPTAAPGAKAMSGAMTGAMQ